MTTPTQRVQNMEGRTTDVMAAPRPTGTIKSIISGDAFKQQVAKALPSHLKPDRFIRVALTTIMRTPKLGQCDQASFLNALMTLSQLGLEPDGRRAHLIPFENRKRGVTECQLIIDYKGLAELAMRSGVVANLHADVVCDNDLFDYDRGQIIQHKIDFRKPRGNPYAAYAICRFKDGTEKAEVLGVSDIEDIRKRSRAGNAGPWVTDWNEMAKKTAFRRLSKWLPLSAEFRDSAEADDEESTPITVESSPSARVEVVPFELPETAPEPQDDTAEAEAGLAPSQEAADRFHAAVAEPPVVRENLTTEKDTPQVTLSNIVTGAGFSFDDLQKCGALDADSLTGFSDIKTADAKRLLGATKALLAALGRVKGGAH